MVQLAACTCLSKKWQALTCNVSAAGAMRHWRSHGAKQLCQRGTRLCRAGDSSCLPVLEASLKLVSGVKYQKVLLVSMTSMAASSPVMVMPSTRIIGIKV